MKFWFKNLAKRYITCNTPGWKNWVSNDTTMITVVSLRFHFVNPGVIIGYLNDTKIPQWYQKFFLVLWSHLDTKIPQWYQKFFFRNFAICASQQFWNFIKNENLVCYYQFFYGKSFFFNFWKNRYEIRTCFGYNFTCMLASTPRALEILMR